MAASLTGVLGIGILVAMVSCALAVKCDHWIVWYMVSDMLVIGSGIALGIIIGGTPEAAYHGCVWWWCMH